MNNYKEKIKLYFKKRTQRVSVFGLSVFVDWVFILLCSFLVVCIGFIYGFLMYKNVSSGVLFEMSVDTVPLSESQNKEIELDRVVKYLKER